MDSESIDPMDEAKTVIPPGSRFWRHAKAPRNLGFCDRASASALGVGSCGDKMRVDLRIENHAIDLVRCKPEGCVYTIACASAMSELAQGRTIDEALRLQPEDVVRELGGLPDDHVHCARLAVNTLGEAIAEYYRRQLADGQGRSNTPLDSAGN